MANLKVDAQKAEPSKASKTGDHKYLRMYRGENNFGPPSDQNFAAMQRLSKRRCVVHPSTAGSVIAAISDAEGPFRR